MLYISPNGKVSYKTPLKACMQIGNNLCEIPLDKTIQWRKDGSLVKTGSTSDPDNLIINSGKNNDVKFTAFDANHTVDFVIDGEFSKNVVLKAEKASVSDFVILCDKQAFASWIYKCEETPNQGFYRLVLSQNNKTVFDSGLVKSNSTNTEINVPFGQYDYNISVGTGERTKENPVLSSCCGTVKVEAWIADLLIQGVKNPAKLSTVHQTRPIVVSWKSNSPLLEADIRVGMDSEWIGTSSYSGDFAVKVPSKSNKAILSFDFESGKRYFIQVSLDGNKWVTGYFSINSKPVVKNVSILPSVCLDGKELSVGYLYEDKDGDKEGSKTIIKWILDGKEQPDLEGKRVVPSERVKFGQKWSVKVRPHDNFCFGDEVSSQDVLVQNIPIKLVGAFIYPLRPSTASDLICKYHVIGQEKTKTIRWFRNGEEAPELSDLERVPASFLFDKEKWYFSVSVRDDCSSSQEIRSMEVEISQGKPVVSNLLVDGSSTMNCLAGTRPIFSWNLFSHNRKEQQAYRLLIGTQPLKTNNKEVVGGNEIYDSGVVRSAVQAFQYVPVKIEEFDATKGAEVVGFINNGNSLSCIGGGRIRFSSKQTGVFNVHAQFSCSQPVAFSLYVNGKKIEDIKSKESKLIAREVKIAKGQTIEIRTTGDATISNILFVPQKEHNEMLSLEDGKTLFVYVQIFDGFTWSDFEGLSFKTTGNGWKKVSNKTGWTVEFSIRKETEYSDALITLCDGEKDLSLNVQDKKIVISWGEISEVLNDKLDGVYRVTGKESDFTIFKNGTDIFSGVGLFTRENKEKSFSYGSKKPCLWNYLKLSTSGAFFPGYLSSVSFSQIGKIDGKVKSILDFNGSIFAVGKNSETESIYSVEESPQRIAKCIPYVDPSKENPEFGLVNHIERSYDKVVVASTNGLFLFDENWRQENFDECFDCAIDETGYSYSNIQGVYSEKEKISDVVPNCMIRKDGTTLIGTNNGLIVNTKESTFTLSSKHGLSSDCISCIYFKDVFYVGGPGGLTRLNTNWVGKQIYQKPVSDICCIGDSVWVLSLNQVIEMDSSGNIRSQKVNPSCYGLDKTGDGEETKLFEKECSANTLYRVIGAETNEYNLPLAAQRAPSGFYSSVGTTHVLVNNSSKKVADFKTISSLAFDGTKIILSTDNGLVEISKKGFVTLVDSKPPVGEVLIKSIENGMMELEIDAKDDVTGVSKMKLSVSDDNITSFNSGNIPFAKRITLPVPALSSLGAKEVCQVDDREIRCGCLHEEVLYIGTRKPASIMAFKEGKLVEEWKGDDDDSIECILSTSMGLAAGTKAGVLVVNGTEKNFVSEGSIFAICEYKKELIVGVSPSAIYSVSDDGEKLLYKGGKGSVNGIALYNNGLVWSEVDESLEEKDSLKTTFFKDHDHSIVVPKGTTSLRTLCSSTNETKGHVHDIVNGKVSEENGHIHLIQNSKESHIYYLKDGFANKVFATKASIFSLEKIIDKNKDGTDEEKLMLAYSPYGKIVSLDNKFQNETILHDDLASVVRAIRAIDNIVYAVAGESIYKFDGKSWKTIAKTGSKISDVVPLKDSVYVLKQKSIFSINPEASPSKKIGVSIQFMDGAGNWSDPVISSSGDSNNDSTAREFGNVRDITSKGLYDYTFPGAVPSAFYTSSLFNFSGTKAPTEIGYYYSEIFNGTAALVQWFEISWEATTPVGTTVSMQVRSASSSDAIDSASWSTEITNPLGSDITNQTGQYLQFRAKLTSTVLSVTPSLTKVTILLKTAQAVHYFTKNFTLPDDLKTGILTYNGTTNPPATDLLFGICGLNSTDFADYYEVTPDKAFQVPSEHRTSNLRVGIKLLSSETEMSIVDEFAMMFSLDNNSWIQLNNTLTPSYSGGSISTATTTFITSSVEGHSHEIVVPIGTVTISSFSGTTSFNAGHKHTVTSGLIETTFGHTHSWSLD